MSGIDTSRGINSVASTIAALEANGAQVVTTNTGAHVRGLEAAAYEFGAILASYPADAPPLTRNAAVFQVTDANGRTSMVSLNDLADDIRRQTGFDPLVEFSVGIGATNQGYSVADINHVLSQIENRYSSMSFTQLTQVIGNQDLVVNDNLGTQAQNALTQFQDALHVSLGSMSLALNTSPGGVGLDQEIIVSPVAREVNARALEQLPELNQELIADQVDVMNAQAALAAAQAGFSPQNQAAVSAAQAALAAAQALAVVNAVGQANEAAVTTAQANLAAAQQALAAAQAAAVGALPPRAFLQGLANGLQSINTSLGGWGSIEGLCTDSYLRDHFLMSANGLFQGTNETWNGNGNFWSEITFYNDLSNEGNLSWSQYHQQFPQATFQDYRWGVNNQSSIYAQIAPGGVGVPAFNGLIQACGLDPTLPSDVLQFNSYLEAVMPGASTKGCFTLGELVELKNLVATNIPLASQSSSAFNAITTASQNVAQAQGALNLARSQLSSDQALAIQNANVAYQAALTQAQNDQAALIAQAQATLNTAVTQFNLDQNALTSLMSAAIANDSSGARSIDTQINQINASINSNLNTVVSLNTQKLVAESRSATASELKDDLNDAIAALNASPSNIALQANVAMAKKALETFLGSTYGTNAAALAACDQYIQSQATQIGNLTQQLSAANTLLQGNQNQLLNLQTRLLNIPNESFSGLLASIENSTGVDLSQAFSEILQDGPLTLGKLNQIYRYLNQNLPGGEQFQLISNSQLIQAASSQISDLLSQAGFLQALANNPGGINPDMAVFRLPGSDMPVSFNAALNTIAAGSGVNVAQTMSAMLDGRSLTQRVVNEIKIYCSNPPGAGAVFPPMTATGIDPTSGESVSITGVQAAKFNLASQLNQINLEALANAGSPISADAAIFVLRNADGSTENVSLNQIIQSYAEKGYDFSSILPPGTNSFSVADLSQAVGRLNADQTSPVFRVSNRAVLNEGLLRVEGYAKSSIAQSPESIQSAVSLLRALGVQNPERTYFQAILATQLESFGTDNTFKIMAESGGKLLASSPLGDPPSTLTFLSLATLADKAGLDLNAIASGMFQADSKYKPIAVLNGASMNALINQLNIANAGTPFVINNLFASSPDIATTNISGQVGFASFATNSANSSFSANLNNNFVAIDLSLIPAMSVNAGASFTRVSANLNSFSVEPHVRAVLSDLGQALAQLTVADLDSAGNLSITRETFQFPSVAQSLGKRSDALVSFEQILQHESRLRGVDIRSAIPNLVNADGNISLGNLSDFGELINQAVPGANIPSTMSIIIRSAQSQIESLSNSPARQLQIANNLIGSIGSPTRTWHGNTTETINQMFHARETFIASLWSYPQSLFTELAVVGVATGRESVEGLFQGHYPTTSLAGLLGIPRVPLVPPALLTTDHINAQYRLVTNALHDLVPDFVPPALARDWTAETFSSLLALLPNSVENFTNQVASLSAQEDGLSVDSITNTAPGQYQNQLLVIEGLLENAPTDRGTPVDFINAISSQLGLQGQNGTPAQNAVAFEALLESLSELLPGYSFPENAASWTVQTGRNLLAMLEVQTDTLKSVLIPLSVAQSGVGSMGLDVASAKTNLQNIQFMDVEAAVEAGQASAGVAASARAFNPTSPPSLSPAEMNAQLEAGDLYVNARGQFFLNRQPTNARDAAVAAFVISGNRQNEKLNDLMNKVNLNNTKIQMASALSACTSVAELRASIASMKEQYGFADILSELTGGAMSDAGIIDGTDISATGSLMSSLKTAISNATRNQDLDTQSLQQLTSQIQANNTAMTQLIQSFEQMLKGLTQNLR